MVAANAPQKISVRLALPAGVGAAPPESRHPILLRGYDAPTELRQAPPVLVKRTEAEFLAALIADLRDRKDLQELGKPNALSHPDDFENGYRRLYQPVHRAFNVVLLEAACDRPGFPRLDPKNFVGASCMLRRVVDVSRPQRDEAWLHQDGQILGWTGLSEGLSRIDPDPKFRVRSPLAQNPHLHGRLAALLVPALAGTEPVSPLFMAPPDVCAVAEKSIVYGLVPVTSSEQRSVPRDEPVDDTVVAQTTPEFLKALGRDYTNSTILPKGGAISADDIEQAIVNLDSPPPAIVVERRRFVDQLRLLASVWRAFDDTPESQELLRRLNGLQVQITPDGASPVQTRPLGEYLSEAVRRLVLRTESGSVIFPYQWLQPTPTEANGIRDAAKNCLQARVKSHGPSVKRFDEEGALYRLHCFVRVRCADGCPPELHWAPPSEPFRIVPWWDSTGTPVQTISLPELTRESVKKLKPNVAFVLPPGLAALLDQSSPKDLRDGKAPGLSIGLGWICSFSIPVITICAFIVLNIFLSLFHLIFGWLFYLKICLPFPKFNSPPRP